MQLTHVVSVHGDSTALLGMMERFNRACNALSRRAFEDRTFSWLPLQRSAYHWLRGEFGLTSAQATVAVRKVSYAYKIKTRRGSLVTFRLRGGVPLFRHSYRADVLRLYGLTVSYATRPGISLPRNAPQAVLIYRDGRFFVQQPLPVATPTPSQPTGYLGLDLGIVNIAADSDGTIYAGGKVNGLRRRHAKLRARLQCKGTKSAKRLLKTRRRREGRFGRDVNHIISKRVVATAQGTGRGIALEDLQGIRDRITVRKAHRRQHHAWSFFQLRAFIEYKAARASVIVAFVDPRNTSRTCPACGCVDNANRRTQAAFLCVSCGFGGHADTIAAGNIARRAVGDQPDAAACLKALAASMRGHSRV